MTDISRSYQQELHRRAYPPLDQVSMEALTGPVREQGRVEAGLRAQQNPYPEKPPVTPGLIGITVLDTLASLLKGATAASLGLPGDIESLVRLLTGGEQKLPTTEDMEAKLPAVVPEGADPRRKVTEKGATMLGEFMPVAPLGAAKGVIKAVGKSKAAAAGVGAAAAVDNAGAAEATPPAGRFSVKNGQLIDSGTKSDWKYLEAYVERQKKAIANNEAQGPLGEMANKLLRREVEHAEAVLKQKPK